MTNRPSADTKQPSGDATSARAVVKDVWLLSALVVTVAIYTYLLFLRPTGENWGRGWNMIAFFLYAAPASAVSAGIALWRAAKSVGAVRNVATWVAIAALVFTPIALVVMRLRA